MIADYSAPASGRYWMEERVETACKSHTSVSRREADTCCWNSLTEKRAMRDDRVVPIDRVDGQREDATRPGTPSSAAQADGTSADPRADSPAPLAAVSHLADAGEPGLSDEEIAIYRRRVADGMYNTREVADEVARRMMRRGDI